MKRQVWLCETVLNPHPMSPSRTQETRTQETHGLSR